MIQTLLSGTQYNGKYVAMKDFSDHTVVGSGATPQEAFDSAEANGCKDPVLTFVPSKDMVQIY
jgi:hypothetical protein